MEDLSPQKDALHVSFGDILFTCSLIRNKAGYNNVKNIVAVVRGGLTPAAALAHMYGIKQVHVLQAEGYSQDDKLLDQALINLDPKVAELTMHQDTLIVDDIWDTGRTMSVLHRIAPDCMKAVCFAKVPAPKKGLVPDWLITGKLITTDRWLQFPWEVS